MLLNEIRELSGLRINESKEANVSELRASAEKSLKLTQKYLKKLHKACEQELEIFKQENASYAKELESEKNKAKGLGKNLGLSFGQKAQVSESFQIFNTNALKDAFKEFKELKGGDKAKSIIFGLFVTAALATLNTIAYKKAKDMVGGDGTIAMAMCACICAPVTEELGKMLMQKALNNRAGTLVFSAAEAVAYIYRAVAPFVGAMVVGDSNEELAVAGVTGVITLVLTTITRLYSADMHMVNAKMYQQDAKKGNMGIESFAKGASLHFAWNFLASIGGILSSSTGIGAIGIAALVAVNAIKSFVSKKLFDKDKK